MEGFDRRLKTLRLEHGLSQAKMAKLLGVSARVYAYFEEGARIPKAEILGKIVEQFNVTFDWLLNGNDTIAETNVSYGEQPSYVRDFCDSDEGQKMIVLIRAAGVGYEDLRDALMLWDKHKRISKG